MRLSGTVVAAPGSGAAVDWLDVTVSTTSDQQPDVVAAAVTDDLGRFRLTDDGRPDGTVDWSSVTFAVLRGGEELPSRASDLTRGRGAVEVTLTVLPTGGDRLQIDSLERMRGAEQEIVDRLNRLPSGAVAAFVDPLRAFAAAGVDLGDTAIAEFARLFPDAPVATATAFDELVNSTDPPVQVQLRGLFESERG